MGAFPVPPCVFRSTFHQERYEYRLAENGIVFERRVWKRRNAYAWHLQEPLYLVIKQVWVRSISVNQGNQVKLETDSRKRASYTRLNPHRIVLRKSTNAWLSVPGWRCLSDDYIGSPPASR